MGSLTRKRAKNRLLDALNQRLEEADSHGEVIEIYEETVSKLADLATDSVELNRLAEEIAVDPDKIDFPD